MTGMRGLRPIWDNIYRQRMSAKYLAALGLALLAVTVSMPNFEPEFALPKALDSEEIGSEPLLDLDRDNRSAEPILAVWGGGSDFALLAGDSHPPITVAVLANDNDGVGAFSAFASEGSWPSFSSGAPASGGGGNGGFGRSFPGGASLSGSGASFTPARAVGGRDPTNSPLDPLPGNPEGVAEAVVGPSSVHSSTVPIFTMPTVPSDTNPRNDLFVSHTGPGYAAFKTDPGPSGGGPSQTSRPLSGKAPGSGTIDRDSAVAIAPTGGQSAPGLSTNLGTNPGVAIAANGVPLSEIPSRVGERSGTTGLAMAPGDQSGLPPPNLVQIANGVGSLATISANGVPKLEASNHGSEVIATIGLLSAGPGNGNSFTGNTTDSHLGFPRETFSYPAGAPNAVHPTMAGDGGMVAELNNISAGDTANRNVPNATLSSANQQGFGPSADVPEPATLALLALGLVGIGFSRRRQAVTDAVPTR